MNRQRLICVSMVVILVFLLPGGALRSSAAPVVDCSTQAEIPAVECSALVALYNSTDGAHWTNNTGWLSDTPSSWFGVTTSGGYVTWIELANNHLAGTIPVEVASLAHVQVLDLSSNQLTGSIPKEVGSMAALQSLALDSNQLTGSIPPELKDLWELVYLNLGSNQLSGTLPTDIGGDLWYIVLSANQFSGSIPWQWQMYVNLMVFDLHDNQLSGTIPSNLTAKPDLEELDLSGNQLSGRLPWFGGSAGNLKKLDVHGNLLWGRISELYADMSQMNYFDASSTYLCEPQDAGFQAWKAGVATYSAPGLCYSVSGTIQEGETPLAYVEIFGGGKGGATSGSDGTYTADFLPGSYTLTPILPGHLFTPASRSVTLTDANLTGQDFTAVPAAASIFLPLIKR